MRCLCCRYLLQRGFVKFVIDCIAASDGRVSHAAPAGECGLVTHLLDWAQYKLSSEELFFQSVLGMSRFCRDHKSFDLRHSNWKTKGSSGCQHRADVDWCGSSPQWLPAQDYLAVAKAVNNHFFSRKCVCTPSPLAASVLSRAMHTACKCSAHTARTHAGALLHARGSLFYRRAPAGKHEVVAMMRAPRTCDLKPALPFRSPAYSWPSSHREQVPRSEGI